MGVVDHPWNQEVDVDHLLQGIFASGEEEQQVAEVRLCSNQAEDILFSPG